MSGPSQVYVSPIPANGDQWQVSSAGGEHPHWRGDGRELFYIAPDGSMMSALISPSAGFHAASPQTLFKTGLVADQFSQQFVVTADGRRFLFNMFPDAEKPPTTTTVRVILNWGDGLTR